MRISDIVAEYLLRILEDSGGNIEIQRNELAVEFGCVPSQINYVLTSRFTPEQGYIVESKRGGGGYIRITRVKMDRSSAIMHAINAIGKQIDYTTASAILQNMQHQDVITINIAKAIGAAISERSYMNIPSELRDYLRAALFKNMLLTQA